jgi:hypothetical protein
MKKRYFTAIVAAILISGAFISCCSYPHIEGNGDMVTFERTVSHFEKIKISGSVVVNYRASQEYRVVVTVDSNLEEYTRVYTEGNLLKIGTQEKKSYSFTKYIVDIYCPKLSAVSISGSVRFNGIDKIYTPIFELEISGSGRINAAFECENFSAKISGSGDITAKGSAKETNISVSGSGEFKGNDFQTNNAIVDISGSGEMWICVLEHLKAKVSGSGKITYRGNPRIDYNGSGSGSLKSEA